MEQKDLFENEFDRQYGDSYREGNSAATNSNHQLPSNAAAPSEGTQSTTPTASEDAKDLAAQMAPKDLGKSQYLVCGYDPADFVLAMYPKGPNCRHDAARDLYNDLLVMYDANVELARNKLLSIPWVQDLVTERGMSEIDRIVEGGRKLLHKRESENFNAPQPSKEMRKAIKQVTGRDYSALKREQRSMELGQTIGVQDDIIKLLEDIGGEIEKLFPRFPLLKLLCHRLPRKHYIAALFVGGAFLMTLMTRCWYRFWSAPGRQCRLNSLLALIGRPGSGKHMAVELYKLLMEPIRKADQVQIDALNRWNQEKDQKNGGSANKTPRPCGAYRALPSETSAAGAREAETNAKETIDGEEWYLHVSQFDSELDNTLRQMKKTYMEALFTLWLKSFHNEFHGSLLKTSSAHVGEYPVHYNCCYTGTADALKKMATEANFVNGLLSRFTFVPMGDSDYVMMEAHEYDDADAERDRQLSEWAYLLDATKGEISCKIISDALYRWTARRMEDAKENNSKAEEDMIKRPCWHGINYALPFVVSRHWDKMVEDGGRYKCGEDFQSDKYDVQLALLIAKAQLAFQKHYFMAIGEKHYDDQSSLESSGSMHRQKTWLGFRRLPEVFSSDDVDRAFSYEGKVGSICSKLKRLVDDGMAQKITKGPDKGKYRKLM